MQCCIILKVLLMSLNLIILPQPTQLAAVMPFGLSHDLDVIL